ncbi:electron transfer flavoprotein subunit beta/FixA family protein [Rothia sp. AR01]|uniref:Electron transfer flavoprotein subunit beta n=1 Tax=Rothia santali TaxID=2949643 RepID=A0A9X2KIJ2_9MICC|nr:electron transfer flavoprotein subunit beta/FixA family protein [Rothia santali]MCP3426952.1 electron transfer flavoprotein subunit beta/FixA family protein [Rothia santali]
MKIVVLAKEVPDTEGTRRLDPMTGLLDRSASELTLDEINERSVVHALRYREGGNEVEIVVLSVGHDAAEASIRKLLALGADSAVVVTDPNLANADAARTSQVIAAAVKKLGPDLVISGNQSTDGRGGVVPGMVAEYLGWPVLPALDKLEINAEGVAGEAPVDGEQLSLSAEFPAVVSVTEWSAEVRFANFKGIMKAKKKPFDVWSLADLEETEPRQAAWVMVSATERPRREAGPKIIDDGSAATQLIDYLAEKKLL